MGRAASTPPSMAIASFGNIPVMKSAHAIVAWIRLSCRVCMPAHQPSDHHHDPSELWRVYMTTGDMPAYVGAPPFMRRVMRPVLRWMPSAPHCRICYFPLGGLGGRL